MITFLHSKSPVSASRIICLMTSLLSVSIYPSLAEVASPPPQRTLKATGDTSFYLGRVNLLSQSAPTDKSSTEQPTQTTAGVAHSLSHTFVLTNATNDPITISEFKTDCGCVEATFDTGQTSSLPYVLPPAAQIEVSVALDPAKVSGGRIAHKVDVMTADQEQPLASLNVRAIIDNGVAFGSKEQREDILKLPAVPQGIASSRLVYMTLDARLPQYLLPGTKLRLVSTQPTLTVSLVSSAPLVSAAAPDQKANADAKAATTNAVTLDNDIISFADNTPLAQDCVLVYRVTADKKTPAGRMSAYLVLATDQPPPYAMLNQIAIPIQVSVRGARSRTPAQPPAP